MKKLEIVDDAHLERMTEFIQEKSALILEHRFYRMGRSPEALVFYDASDLVEYIKEKGRPGDRFYYWAFETVCTDAAMEFAAVVPDASGAAPTGESSF